MDYSIRELRTKTGTKVKIKKTAAVVCWVNGSRYKYLFIINKLESLTYLSLKINRNRA